ncbi:hypothetical protein SAMCFNEI73_Ch3129 [Sinorhizobium americanum]|uniref:Uncharacterized protein n=1 Tax=Sinorhizobium americanum TaxID=194963 RepID=A0A1L3LQT7_9HYPH|nr:hypothetical protein SAMCFNEI73_Ch3129 [Sinorhizobium americanum]
MLAVSSLDRIQCIHAVGRLLPSSAVNTTARKLQQLLQDCTPFARSRGSYAAFWYQNGFQVGCCVSFR